MTPIDVLNTIRLAGGRVVVLDGDLQVIAPPGTLTPAAVVVLKENKAALIGILPNVEREAIQWVENLAAEKAAVAIEKSRQEWAKHVEKEEPVVIQVEIIGSELILHCPTPEIAAKIEAGRHQIDQVFAEIKAADDLSTWEEAVEPIPCSTCGSIMAWWDFTNCQHCMVCEPMERSQRIRNNAARLRAKSKSSRIRLPSIAPSRHTDTMNGAGRDGGPKPAPHHKQT